MSAKSRGLETKLRARIAAHGPLGFDEFMGAALYDPQDGYYASAEPRTGKHGDFFTNVSVGPVFGKLLAAQFLEMRAYLGDPESFTIVEQGANDGQLLADILGAWRGGLPRVIIVEPLDNLRALQKKTLAPWSDRVIHLPHESDLPEFTGVFFANELLDAFPVKLLVREGTNWRERRVGHDREKFIFVEVPYSGVVPHVPNEIPRFATEICTSLGPWMQTIASKLASGWIFLVDYGHPAAARYRPARANGSLAAYRKHQRVDDPLAEPGAQDLTAHVDFTAAARAAQASGLSLAGFTDQHHALAALAEKVFHTEPDRALSEEAAREMRALRHLLHPESMGTSFKFLALAKNSDAPLRAFRFARDAQGELFA